MSDWRDISTAPKDGTHILVARLGDPAEFMEITEWYVIENFEWQHFEGDLWRKVKEEPSGFWNGNGHCATHWQPLPEPPAAPDVEWLRPSDTQAPAEEGAA